MEAIGLLEFFSIGVGVESTDSALKSAEVELLLARPICPGRYISLFRGEVAAVRTAVEAGRKMGKESIADTLIIPNVHPSVFPAISGTTDVHRIKALGIIETFTVASCIEAADKTAKTATVQLVEIRLAIGMGGKSYLSVTGNVSAGESAISAGTQIVKDKGLLVSSIVIPSPREELGKSIL